MFFCCYNRLNNQHKELGMRLTFDLDNVIFNMKPLYQEAFRRAGIAYYKPTSWDLHKAYHNEKIVSSLLELFKDDLLYTMPVLDAGIPKLLNELMARPDVDVLFVTERRLKQPDKTFMQLRNAGIKCAFNQVYDQEGQKPDILSCLKPDMHFDDGPLVVAGCLEKHVPITMISNNNTLYNHYLRPMVTHHKCLRNALAKYNINHR